MAIWLPRYAVYMLFYTCISCVGSSERRRGGQSGTPVLWRRGFAVGFEAVLQAYVSLDTRRQDADVGTCNTVCDLCNRNGSLLVSGGAPLFVQCSPSCVE